MFLMFTGGVCPIACWDTSPPFCRHPPRQTPPSRHPPCVGRHLCPPLDTTGYGQQAGCTHPTGMHSCFAFTIWYWAKHSVSYDVQMSWCWVCFRLLFQTIVFEGLTNDNVSLIALIIIIYIYSSRRDWYRKFNFKLSERYSGGLNLMPRNCYSCSELQDSSHQVVFYGSQKLWGVSNITILFASCYVLVISHV